jgi:3',5'-cyclic AMP phosphodiesterase CpdA
MRVSFPSILLCTLAACFSTHLFAGATAEHSATRFVVTDLFLASADSLSTALAVCGQYPIAQSVGIDWGNANHGRVLQLCLKRERLDSLLYSSNSSSSPSSTSTHVIQRISVYKSSKCLETENSLFRPKDDVIVCVRRLPLSNELLSSGNFISDVWVSKDKNYNSDIPGWNAIGTSVLEPADSIWRALWQWMWTPTYSGAFITYQKPLLPIREVKLVTVAKDKATADGCMDALGHAWEVAGREYLDIRGDDKNKRMLCLRRGDTATSDKVAMVLTAASVPKSKDATCHADGDNEGIATLLPLGASDRYLCLAWNSLSTTSHSVVADLHLANMYEPIKRTNYERVSELNLNTAGSTKIHLYAQSSWKELELVDEPADQNGLLNKPPLVAKVRTDDTNHKNASLSFKILQIADLHYSGDPTTSCNDVPDGMKSRDCSEALMTKFVNELLDLEKPDFVAFTGDNVQVYSKRLRQAAIDIVTKGVEERGIPFAVIFGNHDDERGFTREQMMKMYVKKPHAYSRRGPLNVDGVGNYELNLQAPVDGPWGKKGSDVFRMYFLDSGAYPDDRTTPNHVSKYDWIRPRQIAYYRQLSNAHAAMNNRVPAIMFFHIPLPEYEMDTASLRTVGDHKEGVASSGINSNLFSSLAEIGEVKATFCGHDHVNDYCYKREGVHLCYGGGIGFGTAYGWSSVKRRARVIEWSVDNQNRRTITSWRRIFGESDRRQLEEVIYTEV